MHTSKTKTKTLRDLRLAICLKVYLLIVILAMGAYQNAHATELRELKIANPELLDINTEEDPLYVVLLAEMALNRGSYAEALNYYLKAAYMSKDPKIAEEAALLAIALEAPKESIQAATLWASVAPDNLQAQLVATTLTIGNSLKDAIPFLKRAIELDPEEVEKNIVDVQIMLSENGAKNLALGSEQIAKQRPKDPHAHLIAALCAATLGEMDKANSWVDSALKQQPHLTAAIELKARLIYYSSNSDQKALDYLAKQLERYTDDAELRFFYANALLDAQIVDEAQKQFTSLTQNQKFGGPSHIFLSEIAFDQGNLDVAVEQLKSALKFEDTRDSASYLLGQIDEQLGKLDNAIFWYSTIDTAPYQVPGALRAVALLKAKHQYDDALQLIHESSPTTFQEQKELFIAEIDLMNLNKQSDKALDLVNELLEKVPNDHDFLVMRALTAINLNKLTVAEKDVRLILNENPNNANALSLLGYILAQNDTRLDEALSYLKQALALSPNNPAFMDSMGWTYCRMGDIKNALTYLEKAHSLTQDSEIAAHFGEVLWMDDQKNEAMDVWQNALENNSNDQEILKTLKRLNIELKAN